MIYLQLFHGRKTVKEDMVDWGTDGPVLGPWDNFHWTYGSTLRLVEDTGTNEEYWLDENPGFKHDLIYYAGTYYGDFRILGPDDPQVKHAVAFNTKLAVVPKRRRKHVKR